MHPEITPVARVTLAEAVEAASKYADCKNYCGHHACKVVRYVRSLSQPPAPASFDCRGFVRKCMFAEYDGVSLESQIDRLTAELATAFADRAAVPADVRAAAKDCERCGGSGMERWLEFDGTEEGQQCEGACLRCDGKGLVVVEAVKSDAPRPATEQRKETQS